MTMVNGLGKQGGQTGQTMQAWSAKTEDSIAKNIQKQIFGAQKQLQEMSADKEMSTEEKMKKRQEIQEQIAELNNQLRQRQIEQRTEKQQEKKTSAMDNLLGGSNAPKTNNSNNQGGSFSQAGMQVMISADGASKLARAQGRAASQKEGQARVLRAEIKQDSAIGGNTEAKEKKLAKIEQEALAATASQMNTLAVAIKNIEAANKGEQTKEGEKANKDNEKTEPEKVENTDGNSSNNVFASIKNADGN